MDIEALPGDQIQVRVKGVDAFDPNTGDIRIGDTKSIAAWFIDTDYDEVSFFVRHACGRSWPRFARLQSFGDGRFLLNPSEERTLIA